VFTKTAQKKLVGLEIEAGSIAATEVSVNGSTEVTGHAIAPLESGIFNEGEVADPEALGDALKALFAEHKLSRSVRVGIANQRVAVRSLQLPSIADKNELDAAVRFQAQDHIPMPLEQAVLDWEVVGHSAGSGGEPLIQIVAVAARREMLEMTMTALERAGLRPVGIDLSAFGMTRALNRDVGPTAVVPAVTTAYEDRAPADAPAQDSVTPPEEQPANLYASLGDITNLAVVRSVSCLFTRIVPFGIEGVAQTLSARRELTLEHSRQWLNHVGLKHSIEELEGDAEIIAATREILNESAAKLAEEFRLSLDYYGTQPGAAAINEIVFCGAGTTVPGLVERLQVELGYPCRVSRPAALQHLEEAAVARLTVPFGLALEG
jgi:type IV pilus assembly protein PilM